MANQIKIDNGADVAKIGDYVGFKADIETYGKVVRIEGSYLIIRCRDDVTDETYEIGQPASRCWKE